jgi:hypothetical protein
VISEHCRAKPGNRHKGRERGFFTQQHSEYTVENNWDKRHLTKKKEVVVGIGFEPMKA